MESTENTPKPEHHLTRKARLAREAKEAEAKSRGNSEQSKPTFSKSISSKKGRFVQAFKEENHYYVLCRVNKAPSIKNSRQPYFPQRYLHPGIDVVIHPETGKSCTIRYMPGQHSIFKDEQTAPMDAKGTPIIFEEGLCKVGEVEENLRLFLDLCNANRGAKNRNPNKPFYFFKFEAAKLAEKNYDDGIELARARVYMDDKRKTDEGIEQLLAYAKTLQINMNRNLSEILADLSTFLTQSPKKFLEGLDSPKMKRKYIIMEALDMGVLTKDTITGAITWPNGAGICVPPIGKDPIEYCVDWTFDAGQNTYDHIKEETEKMLLERA